MPTRPPTQQRLKTHSMSGREGPEEACSSSCPFYRWGNGGQGVSGACPNGLESAKSTRAERRSPSSRAQAPSLKVAQEAGGTCSREGTDGGGREGKQGQWGPAGGLARLCLFPFWATRALLPAEDSGGGEPARGRPLPSAASRPLPNPQARGQGFGRRTRCSAPPLVRKSPWGRGRVRAAAPRGAS